MLINTSLTAGFRSVFHSNSFKPMLEFFCGQLVAPSQTGPASERLLVRCMVFLNTVLTSKAYKGQFGAFEVNAGAQALVIFWR